MSHAYRCLLLTALTAVLVAAQASPRYAFTAVGLTSEKSLAQSISNAGHVTGRVVTKPFLYSHGVFTQLPSPTYGIGESVNSSGQVVGGLSDGPGGGRAFLYRDGVMHEFAGPGSTANAINEAGHVAGTAVKDGYGRAFLYRDGVIHDLGTLPDGKLSSAMAMNNRGQIAGIAEYQWSEWGGGPEHAFSYENGVMTDLGTLGGTNSWAFGINERGQVVGGSELSEGHPDGEHAFLYENGVMLDLGTLAPGSKSRARGINNLGQVVGWYSLNTGRSFIYHQRFGMRDLNAMVDPASGWFIQGAYSINDRQQIVGLGCKNGQYGAVLLNPIKAGAWVGSDHAEEDEPARHEPAQENPPCPYG
ncbi:HAF repeat-containing protein [Oxalobacteraceae bacterium OTU3REALA1]|nr:HAF repeat-containing protein [Oxalobacteraceae bacterium OTU3REALA1]